MIRHDIHVDVSDAVGTGEALRVAATVVLDPAASGSHTAWFGFPGGGYNRRYYDLQIDGHAGYSQAEFHAGHGDVFVACDHLAVGDSDVPETPLDYEATARANQDAAGQIIAGLRDGSLLAGIEPLDVGATVGLGQSYGGFLLIIGQGNDPVFDGVGILGYSGIQTLPPWRPDVTIEAMLALELGNGPTHPMREAFHFDDVPDDIVRADMTKQPGTMQSLAPWSTGHMPGGPAVATERNPLDPGAVTREASRIAAPVFIGNGVRDVVGDPWSEPVAYRSSRHITVAVIERMAHMHNFASTRRQLWARLHEWSTTVRSMPVAR